MSERPRVVRPIEMHYCFVCEREIDELYSLDIEKRSDEYSERADLLRSRFNEKVVMLLQDGKPLYRHAGTCEAGTVNYDKFEERRKNEE
jgi:hypothetical protein